MDHIIIKHYISAQISLIRVINVLTEWATTVDSNVVFYQDLCGSINASEGPNTYIGKSKPSNARH